MRQTECETETRRTINQILILSQVSFVSIDLRIAPFTVNIFSNFVSEVLFPAF